MTCSMTMSLSGSRIFILFQLYETAKVSKEKGGIQFVEFDAKHGFGHKHIHKAPELPDIIR